METNRIGVIAEWLKKYRKTYPEKSKRKHVHEFLRECKVYFEENTKLVEEFPEWNVEWVQLVSSFYLTYTLW